MQRRLSQCHELVFGTPQDQCDCDCEVSTKHEQSKTFINELKAPVVANQTCGTALIAKNPGGLGQIARLRGLLHTLRGASPGFIPIADVLAHELLKLPVCLDVLDRLPE
eukprot:3611856-Amphidinium_carterae.2